MSLLLEFNNPRLLDPAVAGGKGANLARLTEGGFAVPPGFVIPPDAYRIFLAQDPGLKDVFDALPLDDPALLEQACRQLCARISQLPVPVPLCDALAEALAGFPEGTAFSVRSSATSEDLGGAAFAGQHETYLNCVGADSILDRIRHCWASLWSARAISYRLQAGVGLTNTAMAVVVQKMAFNRVAGVGFCINPVTGNPAEQALDANYGLGESVVGGEFPVDHWVLDKTGGTVLSAHIARKTGQIVADADGTQVIAVPADEADRPCLSESGLASLSDLMRRVEAYYGYPQDIEWGIEGEQLWLLQARPVTRIPPRWTRDESAERFPSVITPLAWDLVEEGFHQSLAYSFELMGLPPFHGKWFALFDNYVYGNQNAVEIYAEGTARALSARSVEELVAALPALRSRYGWVLELPFTWSRDLDRYLLGLGELMAEPLAGLPVDRLWGYVDSVGKPIQFSANLYHYTFNNPINLKDPSGLDPYGRDGRINPVTQCHVQPTKKELADLGVMAALVGITGVFGEDLVLYALMNPQKALDFVQSALPHSTPEPNGTGFIGSIFGSKFQYYLENRR